VLITIEVRGSAIFFPGHPGQAFILVSKAEVAYHIYRWILDCLAWPNVFWPHFNLLPPSHDWCLFLAVAMNKMWHWSLVLHNRLHVHSPSQVPILFFNVFH